MGQRTVVGKVVGYVNGRQPNHNGKVMLEAPRASALVMWPLGGRGKREARVKWVNGQAT